MPFFSSLLHQFPQVRRIIYNDFQWFIHTTQKRYLGDIRASGLCPRQCGVASQLVQQFFSPSQPHILCLHPLGAQLCPRGTHGENERDQSGHFECISFAIAREHLPLRLGPDWSYTPGLRASDPANPLQTVLDAARRYGSVVSYDAIPPQYLRVFCKDNPPADPLHWTRLPLASDSQIVTHHE